MERRKIIRINKLFGRYDNEIDLSKRGIIFIGENGVGKTTIMKMLNDLLNCRVRELIKYDFESVEIEVLKEENEIEKLEIKRNDLLPTNDEIMNYIKNTEFFEEEKRKCFYDIEGNLDDEEKKKILIDFGCDEAELEDESPGGIDEIFVGFSEEFYQEGGYKPLVEVLLEEIIDNGEIRNIIQKVIKKEEFDVLYYYNCLKNFKRWRNDEFPVYYKLWESVWTYEYYEVKEMLEVIVDIIKGFLKDFFLAKSYDEIECYKVGDYFTHRISLEGMVVNILDIKSFNEIFDLHSWEDIKYRYDLSLITKHDWFERRVKLLDMTKSYVFHNKVMAMSEIYYKHISLKPQKNCYGSTIDLFNRIYEYIAEEKEYDFAINSKDISDIESDVIDINSIINHYFYKKDFWFTINKIALKYCIAKDSSQEFEIKEHAQVEQKYDELQEKFIKYIRPIMLRDTPYSKEFGSGHITEFYSNEWHLFEENINPKMKVLQELLDKYLMNKNVEVTPMGILINSKEDNRKIPLNSLSSGEKKLLIIFLHCLFNEDVPILIDEPEISLSIIWQENIFPDLLEKTNIKQIIVATHSPSIISNSCLDEFIIPLPNSIVDRRNPNEWSDK